MICDLGEERTRVTKKKRKKREKSIKKEKNLIAAITGLVGIKEYFKTYYRVKYFLPFLIEKAFYAKLSRRFSGPKTKVT